MANEPLDQIANQLRRSDEYRVIKKYNRHWALVMNPEKASAGSDFVDVAMNPVYSRTVEVENEDKGNEDEFQSKCYK